MKSNIRSVNEESSTSSYFGFRKTNSFLRCLIISLCVIVTILVFVLIALSSFLIFNSFGSVPSVHNDLKEPHEYQILKVSNETDINLGFVTIFEELDEDDNIFYRDINGDHILISNIGVDEYSCSGSCFCTSDGMYQHDRKSASLTKPVFRGLFFLVASISSILAYEKAKEHFDEECRSKLSESCSPTAVTSEVEKCKKVYIWDQEWYDVKEGEPENHLDERRKMPPKFRCKGSCRLGPHLNLNDLIELEKKGFDCKRKINTSIRPAPPSTVEMAKSAFEKEFLENFCGLTFLLLMQKHYEFNPSKFSSDDNVCVPDTKSIVCRHEEEEIDYD